MEKNYLDPVQMLEIASQHAYCADHLLQNNAEIILDNNTSVDTLLPITSLLYTAFELTFKAFLLQEHRLVRQHIKLTELLNMNEHLGLSREEQTLIRNLSKVQAFRKGIDYMLWERREDLHGFCEQTIQLYEKLQSLIPLELQKNYQK